MTTTIDWRGYFSISRRNTHPFRRRRTRLTARRTKVTYTLRRHALPRGIANAMFEIRSDFIETASDQEKIAEQLSALLRAAIAVLDGALMQAET